MKKITIELSTAAHEMAAEEISKQVAFLSKAIKDIRFEEGGSRLTFLAPAEEEERLSGEARELAQRVQRSLRRLQRKIAYRSARMDAPAFLGTGMAEGIHQTGIGQVAMEGLPLRLYRYFDRALAELGAPFAPRDMLTPTLIPATTLARCDYFRSFPHSVTFAAHLPEDAAKTAAFRQRHEERDTLDDQALSDMVTPEACLSPAVCYHVYAVHKDRAVPAQGAHYAVIGRCFRYESSNMLDLRRLWDFTMREIVLMGAHDDVLEKREQGVKIVGRFLEEHEMAGEIRTASDPFFIAPDAMAKAYFQISAETKYEISLLLPGSARLAAGSLNYHTDFFGKAFNVTVEGHGLMHSVCIAFGLERWVYGFLCQHGEDPARWPKVVTGSPAWLATERAY